MFIFKMENIKGLILHEQNMLMDPRRLVVACKNWRLPLKKLAAASNPNQNWWLPLKKLAAACKNWWLPVKTGGCL
jgi:hypothetical protein